MVFSSGHNVVPSSSPEVACHAAVNLVPPSSLRPWESSVRHETWNTNGLFWGGPSFEKTCGNACYGSGLEVVGSAFGYFSGLEVVWCHCWKRLEIRDMGHVTLSHWAMPSWFPRASWTSWDTPRKGDRARAETKAPKTGDIYWNLHERKGLLFKRIYFWILSKLVILRFQDDFLRLYTPIGSMYGIFIYIYLKKSTKCR